jgi:plasmid stability protein
MGTWASSRSARRSSTWSWRDREAGRRPIFPSPPYENAISDDLHHLPNGDSTAIIEVNAVVSCSTKGNPVATLTIRNLDHDLKAKLRLRAAGHGLSMEEEARRLLRRVLTHEEPAMGLGSRITNRFAEVGGAELPLAARSLPRQPFSSEPGEDEE